MSATRHDWTSEEVAALFELPFHELAWRAMKTHREHHDPAEIQLCTLSNIKRGGCPEDCSYCPQSARYQTGVKAESLATVDEVLAQAERAAAAGATRFCMGAAWRKVRDGKQFDRVLDMVKGVSATGMEVCVTLGMLTQAQAERLQEAGLTAYNHNIDTAPDNYNNIITTRTLQDRLDTLQSVRDAGLRVCTGGIIGMGEGKIDRAEMLRFLANMTPHPESVPINKLVKAKGTPLENSDEVDSLDFLRTLAVARILMPTSKVRLAAGRLTLSKEARTMAYMLGANSIFYGEELLTTANPSPDEDAGLIAMLGMRPMKARVSA